MRHRSKKMQRAYVERRRLVAEVLEEREWCEAGHILQASGEHRSCTGRSSEVHEIKTRARGGSILDKENVLALCHNCHRWVTEHPKRAGELGLMKASWE